MPEGLIIEDEIALRKQRLVNLAEAKAVLEARAQERYEAEMAEYEAKQREQGVCLVCPHRAKGLADGFEKHHGSRVPLCLPIAEVAVSGRRRRRRRARR